MHAGDRRVLARGDAVQQGREGAVALAGHDVVDPGQVAEVLQTHFAVEVRATEDLLDVRVPFLEQAAEGEGSGVLQEGRGEADDAVAATPAPVDLRGQPRGQRLPAETHQLVDVLALEVPPDPWDL